MDFMSDSATNASEFEVQSLIAERDQLKQHCERLAGILGNLGHPPGHYYSPLVDPHDTHVVRAVRDRLEVPAPSGINLDVHSMKAMLRRLAFHHTLFPFPRNSDGVHRYYFSNPFFGCHDASVYFSMLLEFRPRRVVEIGCGFSSRLLFDTNDRIFAGKIEITLIDPSLSSLTEPGEPAQANLHSCRVQDVPLALFDTLETNDILFIDSSHVSKTGSDVNFYIFEILPRLRPGVLVHVHDIFWPFEYVKEWVLEEKRSWNEAYVLRAFLEFNDAFEIRYWNNFAFHFLASELKESMPLCMENEGGSLWFQRTGR